METLTLNEPASPAATATEAPASPWEDSFEFEGKTYTIFKRNKSQDGAWYIHYQLFGSRNLVSSATNIKANAVQFFKDHIKAAKAGRRDALQAVKITKQPAAPTYATIGELIQTYETLPLEIDERTRRQNRNSLRIVLRRGRGVDEVDALSTAVLGKELVCVFFEKALTAAKTLPQSEEQSAKRSANSTFNQARSMFKPHILEKLRKRLTLPPLQEFLEAFQVEKFQRVTKRGYNAPADEIIKNTLEAWEKLTDRNMFLAIGHELAYGLRKGEMAQAKWGWAMVKEGTPGLDGECRVKASSGRVQVKALDPFWTIMQTRIAKEGWRGEKDDYVLSGPDSEREDETFRRVGAFMRELGWETQKTNHSLRAYAGSQVAMRYGIYSASGFLRHSSIKVTEQAYTHFVEMHKVDRPEALPAKWAQLVTIQEKAA